MFGPFPAALSPNQPPTPPITTQGAVKIACARSDPAARNCHGYRKFVKRSLLENPASGYLVNDTLVVRYTIELVVSSGGALARPPPTRAPPIPIPPPSLGADLGALLASGDGADVQFVVGDGERAGAHRVVLAARSPVFAAMLTGSMREATAAAVPVPDVDPAVFRALLHFAYTDALPQELEAGGGLAVPLAQHLLAAADRFALTRLRRICERRLCETVDAATVATTLALADQNNAADLKRVCLAFAARHLAQVIPTPGYAHMVTACPGLQAELLETVAAAGAGGDRRRPAGESGDERRVRARGGGE
jgi:speckle-type POZ protein